MAFLRKLVPEEPRGFLWGTTVEGEEAAIECIAELGVVNHEVVDISVHVFIAMLVFLF